MHVRTSRLITRRGDYTNGAYYSGEVIGSNMVELWVAQYFK